MIPYNDLVPELGIKKTFYGQAWVTFDLSTGHIEIRDAGKELFNEIFSDIRKPVSKPVKYYRETKHWIKYNVLKHVPFLYRRANLKTLKTEYVKRIAVMGITKKTSDTYKEADAQYQLLYSLINERGFTQPIYLSCNIGHSDSFLQYMYYVGLGKEANNVWDVWMKSKYTDKDRALFKKAKKNNLLKYVSVKEKPE